MVKVFDVADDGHCTECTVQQSRSGRITFNRKELHLHHVHSGLCLLSPIDHRALQSPSITVSTFGFAPPLNAFVYPMPIFIGCMNEAGRLVDTGFDNVCAKHAHLISSRHLSGDCTASAIYDVPAIPFVVEDVMDTISDDEFNGEEEEDDEHSQDDDEEADDDDIDEDWTVVED